MKIASWMTAVALAVGMLGGTVRAQESKAAAKALTPSEAALAAWNEIGRKVIAMAEDFPEDKYDMKPTPAQRSFAEQLLHVAGGNDYFTDVAQGKKPKDDESREHYKTKAQIVEYLKKQFAEGAALIKAKGEAGMMATVVEAEGGRTVPALDLAYGLIEHGGEHYGQLVVYYRVAGLVPPESRPKKQ
jgi:uncharacterized damage-inducible protein DinB